MSPADPAVLLREAQRKLEHRIKFLEARVQANEERLEEALRLIVTYIEGQQDDGR